MVSFQKTFQNVFQNIDLHQRWGWKWKEQIGMCSF